MTIKVHFNAVNELYPESTGYQFTTNERGTGEMLRDATCRARWAKRSFGFPFTTQ